MDLAKSMSKSEALAVDGTTRILHLTVDLEAGGAERALAGLVASDNGGRLAHRVFCLRKAGFFEATVRDAGVPIDVSPSLGGSYAALRRCIMEWRPHILHCWMYYANLLGRAVVFSIPRDLRPGLVWGIRCSDMDFSRHRLALRVAVKLGGVLSSGVDAIVSNSFAGRRVHETLGYASERFLVIENGFDSERFRPRPDLREEVRTALGIPSERFASITVARTDPMKDYPTLLSVTRACPDIVFVAAGKGTENLQGPENFIGLGRRNDVEWLLHGFDVLTSTSAYGEGMSNSIGEAMASGLPVVATACGDSEVMLSDEDGRSVAGIVRPPGDKEGLAAALRRLEKGSGHAKKMGCAGRKRVEKTYNAMTVAKRYRALYEGLRFGNHE